MDRSRTFLHARDALADTARFEPGSACPAWMGRSSPDATVSVDGELASRGPNGEFKHTIIVDKGPRLVEVIATDLAGGHEEAILAVIYIP